MNRQLFRTYTKLLMWHFHTINITTCKVCSKILCQSCATFFCWSFAHEQNNIDLLWFIVTKPAAALLPYSLSSGVRPSILPFVACLSWQQQQPSLLHHIVIRNFLPSLISVFFCGAKSVPFLGFVAPRLAFLPHTQYFFWYNYLNRTYISTRIAFCCRV